MQSLCRKMIFSFSLVLSIFFHEVSFGMRCAAQVAKSISISAWRKGITNLNQIVVVTDSRLERQMKQVYDAMKQDALVDLQTSPMEIFAGVGIHLIPLNTPMGYGSGVVPRHEVRGLNPSGEFKGVLALPVSGHVSPADAKRWAKTDTYTLNLRALGRGSQKSLVVNAKSLDFATFQNIEFRFLKGQVYRVEYERSGSGGAAAYPEARYIELVWMGK